jgi:hypothetical protein
LNILFETNARRSSMPPPEEKKSAFGSTHALQHHVRVGPTLFDFFGPSPRVGGELVIEPTRGFTRETCCPAFLGIAVRRLLRTPVSEPASGGRFGAARFCPSSFGQKRQRNGNSEGPAKWVAFKWIAELQILTESVEALMPTQAFKLGGVLAKVHARGGRVALKTVAAKIPAAKSSGGCSRLDDLGNGPWRNRG